MVIYLYKKKIINYKFMQAVILCGGLGTRLKNKYKHIPKRAMQGCPKSYRFHQFITDNNG